MKRLSEETIIERVSRKLSTQERNREIATISTNDDVLYGIFINDKKMLLRNIYSSELEAKNSMTNCHSLTELDEFNRIVEADVWVGDIQFKTQISTSSLFVLGVNSPNADAETYAQEWLSCA